MYEEPLSRAEIVDIMGDTIPTIISGVTDIVNLLLPDEVASAVAKLAPRELHVYVKPEMLVKIDQHHKMLPTLIACVRCRGKSPMLVGPAGSGKTTLAEQLAKAIGLPFFMVSRVTSEFKLLGYKDAVGVYHRTQFRDAYENGGVCLFDEADASESDVMTVLNAAISNGYCDFPDGMVDRHPNFILVAAANTYGRGADRQYVGRNQLDAATRDRFAFFNIDYDEALERSFTTNQEWVSFVQRVRKVVTDQKKGVIISPRATIWGADALAAGMSRSDVEAACIWVDMDPTTRQQVQACV
jgi:ATP-dependent Clp protease ATP-binding subunit ClpA